MSRIFLLADRPDLVEPVGRLRWREWGHAPEPEDPAFWVKATRREAGRDALPFTMVAVDAAGAVIGAIGLGEYDRAEPRDRGPWVLGMVVDPARRGRGLGRALLRALQERAAEVGHHELWVATGNAAGFYERCGWRHVAYADDAVEGRVAILASSRSRAVDD